MQWLVAILLFPLLLGVLSGPSQSQQSTPSPSWAEFNLERYPIVPVKREMTDAELAKLGLTRVKLEQPLFVFNHYRALCPKGQVCGKWEWLEAGVEVAQDADGRAWYRVNCANRLYVPVGASPAWFPFGGPGGRWPWWLPWLLLLPLLGLLGYLVGRLRERGRWEPPRPRPENGNGGNGNGGPDLPGPASFRRADTNGGTTTQPQPPAPTVDRAAAARRAALEREVSELRSKAEAHEAKTKELREGFNPAGDPDAGIALLGQIAAEDKAAKAAREAAAAKALELVRLGAAAAMPPAPSKPTPTPAPQPAPTSTPAPPQPSAPPPDNKATMLASLRTAEKKAGIRHRALRVAIDALEQGTMTPDEVQGWLQKLGITLA